MKKLTILMLIVSTSGCAGLANAILDPKPEGCERGKGECRTMKDVEAAKKKKDFKALSHICMIKGKVTLHETRIAACHAGVAVLVQKGDVAELEKICRQWSDEPYKRWLDAKSTPTGTKRRSACRVLRELKSADGTKAFDEASCDNMIEVFRKYEKSLTDTAANLARAGSKLAKCGHWDHIIEELAYRGRNKSGKGYKLIVEMAKGGTDWEAQVLAYAKRKGGGQVFTTEYAYFFLSHFADYLVESGKTNCKPYIKVAARTPDIPFRALNWYFRKTNCTAAAQVIAKRLASDRADVREGACKSLGLLGSKRKHLKKVRLLARTDPYYRVQGLNKVYDVRNACAAAANKLALK